MDALHRGFGDEGVDAEKSGEKKRGRRRDGRNDPNATLGISPLFRR
jgi:hypothetical protein